MKRYRNYALADRKFIITATDKGENTEDLDAIKDSIASQRYATPRDVAVNSVTLRKWRHLIKSVLNYDNEGSNYRDCTSVLGHDSKGSNDKGCTSGHIYPPLTLTHPTCLVDSVLKLVYYFN